MQIAVKDSNQASSDKLSVTLTLIDQAPKKEPSTETKSGEEKKAPSTDDGEGELGDDASPDQSSTSNLAEAVESGKEDESDEEELGDGAFEFPGF